MFKMYAVGMYQLGGSLVIDAAGRRGQTKAERARAASALAGIIASHTLTAGILGGIMLEPLRLLRALWNAAFGDDDEFEDLDTAVMNWAKDVTDSEFAGTLLSRGIWNALGFDLSSRMGLDHVMFYDVPEEFSENEAYAFFTALFGPIPATMIKKAARAKEYWVKGEGFEAISELIPVKLFQDARAAWKLMTEGVKTRGGETVVGPEEFNWVDAVGRSAGFRTTEEATASEKAGTVFRYKSWRSARVRELTAAFWQAYEDGDAKAQAEAVAAIKRFNERNPGAPITGESLAQSKRQKLQTVQERQGQGRNPDLNELLDY
jgi:hypothetical protein